MACTCTPCPFCNGTGNIWRDLDGSYSLYHTDDLQEMETCDQCGGDGIDSLCEECWFDSQEDEDMNP